ncbi:hypothetical protein ABMA27_003464 [Loxostege sticticalis]|uniref:Regulatory protein zeste n=1 Tax=Loxostege sticticalis TaxID=481309 RepID=A0ABR3HT61_LOXSC
MSRSLVAQQEILIECLEEKRWLATGYARTAQARERTNAAWQEICRKLSSSSSGCIKTWQQWFYWKDKKFAVKKRSAKYVRGLARQRTGGGAKEEPVALSSIEERIVALVGGENYAIGDREHEINPFDRHSASPVVVAAVYGTHIKINAPTKDAQSYINRKGTHSIQVQVRIALCLYS